MRERERAREEGEKRGGGERESEGDLKRTWVLSSRTAFRCTSPEAGFTQCLLDSKRQAYIFV